MAETENVWNAREEEPFQLPVACELFRVEENGEVYYQFSMTEGPFSGDPAINLQRYHLEELRDKIIKELESVQLCPNCSGRHNDAYGLYCRICGTRVRKTAWVRYEAT